MCPEYCVKDVLGIYPHWRRGWDSNPRDPVKGQDDFESSPLRPLRYLSITSNFESQIKQAGIISAAIKIL